MINQQQLYRVLKKQFGYSHFRNGQLETIQSVLAGKNTFAILPTGAGKSLLYQLPAYFLPGSIVIVSPLLSLMQDQIDRLRRRGEKRVVMLSSQLVGADRQQVLNCLGNYRFIFASPEILSNQQILAALERVRLSLLVVDEAHCISQWGPDFRPEYLLLKQVRLQLGRLPVLLLTATATPRVQRDILAKLGLQRDEVHLIVRSVNRANIFLGVEQVDDQLGKQTRLLHLVNQLPGPGVAYFSSRKMATQMAEWLREQTGLPIAAYHAGISALERFRVQQQFMTGQLQLICATSAFGMGIDKGDIRYVIHYHLPANLESYMQEIGRAGRDGRQSVALLLYAPGDEAIPKGLNQVSLPSVGLLQQVQQKQLPARALGDQAELFSFYLDHRYQPQQIIKAFKQRQVRLAFNLQKMLNYISLTTCRRAYLLDYFGEEAELDHQNCCDADQPDWQTTLSLPAGQQIVRQSPDTDWEKRLKRLFNIN